MSVTIDSTNPRIIADNIRKLDDAVQTAASELPEVETTDAGKVLTVNASGKWAASDLPTYPVGNIDYSTTEQDTGLKWIDESEIYQKTFTFTSPSEGNLEIDLIASTIISFVGTVINTSLLTYEINRYFAINYSPANEKIYIPASTNTAFVSRPCILTVCYTKPAASRDPEDQETELKKSTKKKTTTKKEEEE